LVLARLSQNLPACRVFLIFVYAALPLLFASVYLALPNSGQLRRRYCAAIFLTSAVVFSLYAVCPAAGPLYRFGPVFPFHMPAAVVPHPIVLKGVRLDATPSGHLAWALIVYWFARRYFQRPGAWLTGVFVLLTICATMGTGEHYAVDLLLGVPTAVSVWIIVHGRWKAAICLLLAVLIWEILLRTGWALHVAQPLVWVACATTLAVPLYLLSRTPSFVWTD
jgi:hypothetical protein